MKIHSEVVHVTKSKCNLLTSRDTIQGKCSGLEGAERTGECNSHVCLNREPCNIVRKKELLPVYHQQWLPVVMHHLSWSLFSHLPVPAFFSHFHSKFDKACEEVFLLEPPYLHLHPHKFHSKLRVHNLLQFLEWRWQGPQMLWTVCLHSK